MFFSSSFLCDAANLPAPIPSLSQEVAVKVASITEMGLDGWKTETSSLQRLHHPNIIRLLGSIYNPSPLTYCLVLEYCNAGDLSAALTKETPPNFFDRVSKDMACGLAFLHSRDVIHRDIKVTHDALTFLRSTIGFF